jgi:signal transduction histidine kinase
MEELENLMNGINLGSERIRDIVKELKNFARVDTENVYRNININEVIKAAVIITNNLIKKSTDNFNVQYNEDLPEVFANFQQIEQVIINLITNSCQALRSKKESIGIGLGLDSSKNSVYIYVKDEGAGIPKSIMDKIFDPFYTTKRNMGGTGLGLSISYKIVESHKGELTFQSELNVGTTAILYLPVLQKKEDYV